MKFRELLDKIVFILYKLKSERGTDYYNLNKITEMTGYHSDLSETINIAKYLEAKGYIKIIAEFGTMFAKITHAGSVYVEDNNLYAEIENFDYNAVPIYKQDDYLQIRKPILDIIKKMKKLVLKNKKIKSDAAKDIYILQLELSRADPNMEIIELKLRDLEKERLLRLYSEQIREALDI